MESLNEYLEYTDLLNSIQEAQSVLSMRNAVINTPQGQSITVTTGSNVTTGSSITGILNGTTTGTTYYTPQYVMNQGVYGTIENIEPPVVPENVIDELTLMIASLEKDEDEQMQKAVKHLTFAKAYLEKMVLDKLNQKL
jgi:hypothetical protein